METDLHKLIFRRGARGSVTRGGRAEIRKAAANILRNVRRNNPAIAITRCEREAWAFAENGKHVGLLEIQAD